MPGVNPSSDQALAHMLAGFDRRIRAVETQQQLGFTNSQGQLVMTTGLVPGSNPAAYGLQILDPATGAQLAFFGENDGSSQFMIKIAEGGTIELQSVATGHTVFFAGTDVIPDGSGRTQQVVYLTRDDGTAALQLADDGTVPNHPHQQALQWFDRSGNAVFADDTVSGAGIARPYIPIGPLVDTNVAHWPSTTATTWTTIANCYAEIQQPRLTWALYLYAPASTTGTFRLMLNGTQLGTTQTVVGGAGGTFSTWSDTQPLPTGVAHGGAYLLELQAEVTAGTGTIAAQQLQLEGFQS